MKATLKSQLETFKKDNTKKSREEMLNTIESISGTTIGNGSVLNTIEAAKGALTSSNINKNEVVQSVEAVISSLS